MSALLEPRIFAEPIDVVEAKEPLLLMKTTKERGTRSSIRRTSRWIQPRISLRSRRSPPSEGKILSLKQFVKKYSSFFPLCVFVEQGYYDPEQHYEVSAGDRYTLKFISTTQSIVVKDRSGKLNMIPTNSHVECTFLYNPEGDLERAKGGYVYPTVRDILDRRTRPNVVIATRDYEGGSEEASVEQSEVLVVLNSNIRKWSRHSESSLSVYSVTLGMAKLLPTSCRGDFSTNPYSTKMGVAEILGHVGKSVCFPIKACLYITPEFEQEIEPHLIDEPLDVMGVRSTECVVATFIHDSESCSGASSSGSQLVELPLHISVTVSLHLHKDSHCTRRRSRVLAKARGPVYQSLVEPTADSAPLYEVLNGPNPNLNSEISTAVIILEKSLKDTSDIVGVLIKEMRSLKICVESSCLSHQPSDSQTDAHSVSANSKLSTLSVQQVCILLDSLGLPQYKAIVTTERISGSILSRLTEADLRNELQITSRLHRLRLMDVIDGRVNINVLLHDPITQH